MDVCEQADRDLLAYHVGRLVEVLRKFEDNKPYVEPPRSFEPERGYNYSRHEIEKEAFDQGEQRVEWEAGEVAEKALEEWDRFVDRYPNVAPH